MTQARASGVTVILLAARRALRDDITASITDASRAYSTRTGRIILGVVLAFVVGAILSGWLLSRLLTFPLYALDYFEHALVESVESADRAPIRLPQALSDRYSVVFRAYDSLVSRLVESEASRLDFLGRVAHELRSPLAAIRGYADLLADPVMPPEGAEAASYARVIGRQSERMQQWVENLVMAAQIEEGLLKLFPAPMRPGPLLDKVVAEARERGRRGITVEDNLGLLRIQADALYLRHAFLNLVDYCMRLPAPDTPVLVTLRQAQTPGWAEIVVVDPALVVAEADLPALFSRSELVRGGRRPSAAGGVLGLYVLQRIIEMHRGAIAGHSRPGQGTTFVISLPLAEGKS